MSFGMQAKKRVGPSLAALLLVAGGLLPAIPEISPPLAAASAQDAEATVLRIRAADAVSGLPLEGVAIRLYWADTAQNRAEGRTPGQAAAGAPSTGTDGRSDLTVQPGADYYVVGEKPGYLPFDSRDRQEHAASGGMIRIGSGNAEFALAMTPARHTYLAYMHGYPDGMFRPDQSVTRAELAAILHRTMGESASSPEAEFRDIASDQWAVSGVALAAANGWMQGTGGSRFEPERAVSRAEMAKILANVYDWEPQPASDFSDTAGHWAAEAIGAAAARGVLNGYPDGTFRPDRPVTRAETAILINRLLERPADESLPMTWSDLPPSHWAYGDAMAASLDHTPSSAR